MYDLNTIKKMNGTEQEFEPVCMVIENDKVVIKKVNNMEE